MRAVGVFACAALAVTLPRSVWSERRRLAFTRLSGPSDLPQWFG